MTESSPIRLVRGPVIVEPEPMTVEALRREVNYAEWLSDFAADQLEDRVIRLEEIVAARWPRSWLLRRRLARELRASVAGYDDHVPPGFRARRIERMSEELILQTTRRRRQA